MISRPLPKTGALRFDATSVEVFPGAIHDPASILLPSSGNQVLSHDHLQARAQFDSHSFLHIWLPKDTSGFRYSSCFPSAGGPCQLD